MNDKNSSSDKIAEFVQIVLAALAWVLPDIPVSIRLLASFILVIVWAIARLAPRYSGTVFVCIGVIGVIGVLLLLIEYSVFRPTAESGVIQSGASQPSPAQIINPTQTPWPPTAASQPTTPSSGQDKTGSLVDWINWIGIASILFLVLFWLRYFPSWLKRVFQGRLATSVTNPKLEPRLESVKGSMFGWPLAAVAWVLMSEVFGGPLGVSIGLLAAIVIWLLFTILFTPKYYTATAQSAEASLSLKDFLAWFLFLTPTVLLLYFVLHLLSITPNELRGSFPVGVNWLGLWAAIILNGVVAIGIDLATHRYTAFRVLLPAISVMWFILTVFSYLVVLVVVSGNVASFAEEWMRANAHIKAVGLSIIDQALLVSQIVSQEINKTTLYSRVIAAIILSLIVTLPGQFSWWNWLSKEQEKMSTL